MRTILLLDNGSKRPQSVINLRRIASELSRSSGQTVHPVSLLHANKIPVDELSGEKAATLGPLAERLAAAGTTELLVLPFFFGPSRALTDYMPERLAEVQAENPGLSIRVARPLLDTRLPVDLRLAQLLADQVRTVTGSLTRPPRVVLVDHGSPIPEVTLVRNYLGGQLSAELADSVRCVTVASMERRPGDQYRFNEPLLETLLADPDFAQGDVILAMLFLSPGRHAGGGGDIATITRTAMANTPGLNVHLTPLVGEHPAIVDLLETRLNQVLAGSTLFRV